MTLRLPGELGNLLKQDSISFIQRALDSSAKKASMRHLLKVLQILKDRKETPGWLHATDSINPCDRKIAAYYLGYRARREITSRTRRILDNGTYTHLRYQATALALPKPWGVEVAKQLQRWPIVGEADIQLFHPKIGTHLLELKTINLLGWRELSAAREEHVQQLSIYMYMATVEHGQIWYENKNDQDLKIYPLEYPTFEIQQMLSRLNVIIDGLCRNILPPVCAGCPDPEFCNFVEITPEKLKVVIDEQQRYYSKP